MRALLFTASLAGLVGLVSAARAGDVWTRTLDGSDAKRAQYDHLLADGDAHVMQAHACMVAPGEARRQVELALADYHKAADVMPAEGEPHFRIASTLDAFFVCGQTFERIESFDEVCPSRVVACDMSRAPELVAELEAFEARSPLDPRLTVVAGTSSLLFERAIVRTKLGTPAQLAGAARDYKTILARGDGSESSTLLSNLAETEMMLGELDDSIDHYREARKSAGGSEAAFGLAVALDRNGQAELALRTIAELPDEEILGFRKRVATGATFFVPKGEVYYYEAMIEESRHNDALALQYWRAFVDSKAHPQYQPRAREHMAALLKRIGKTPTLSHYEIDWDR